MVKINKQVNEQDIAAKSLKARADKAGKKGMAFVTEAAACLVAAFAHTLKFGDDRIIGSIMDRLGPALNRRQVDAWATAYTNLKWNKKEGTYKKPAKGAALQIKLGEMEATPYYKFVKANEVPEKVDIMSAFVSFLAKARLNTEANNAIDERGFLPKVMEFANKAGVEMNKTVPTAEGLARLRTKLAAPAPAVANA